MFKRIASSSVSKATPVVTAGVAGLLLSHALVAAPFDDRVVVRTYDQVGVAPRELATALETARAILSRAAIDLVWRNCGPCDEARWPRELTVRIAAASAQTESGPLGYAVVNVRQRSGSLATILADRVESMASAAEIDAGILLGRAIAHELAHLLLGTTEHSAHGLMRANWTARELQRDVQGDWMLSRDEGARMRRELTARPREPGSPTPPPSEVAMSLHPGIPCSRSASGIAAVRLAVEFSER